jgi:hypothetical protein
MNLIVECYGMKGKIMPLSDEILTEFAEDIDRALIEWGTTYKVDPLRLAAILLGRIVVMTQQTGCSEELFLLTDKVRESIMECNKDNIIH